MAYSDYGGYAFNNGVLVLQRSDRELYELEDPDSKFNRHPHGHVLLGDERIYVGLYKQSQVFVWLPTGEPGKVRSLSSEEMISYAMNLPEKYIWEYKDDNVPRYSIDTTDLADDDYDPIQFNFPGGILWIKLSHEDNYYVYAKLEVDEGDDWYGFSGYGIGSGLEDSGYGYSTMSRVYRLCKIWPGCVNIEEMDNADIP